MKRFGIGARGKLECVDAVVLRGVEQAESVGEIFVGFAGEADDDVGGDADGAARGADQSDFFEIFAARIGAAHGFENARGAGLHREMNVIAQGGDAIDGFDDVGAEIAGMRCGEAHAANAGDGGRGFEKLGECQAARRGIAIGIYSLAEELDFGVAGIGEARDFFEDGGTCAAAFGATREWNDAVGAGLAAAFDDGDVGAEGIVAACQFGLKSFVCIGIEAHHAAIAGFELREEIGQFAIAG